MRILIIIIGLLFFGCNSAQDELTSNNENTQDSSQKTIKYAKGFKIEQFKDYKIITLHNAWVGAATAYKYVLYTNQKPKEIKATTFIKTPIKSIACMSLTHIAFIERLGLENSIKALSGCDHVSSTKIKKKINENSIKEIGQEQQINYELLVNEHPDIIMAYGIDASSNKYIKKAEDLGLKVVLNAEYMETHPLGKAEWIKFIAAFYNKENQADSIFKAIEKEYVALLSITKNIKEQPTVFTGMPWNGSWYVAGAKSFQVQFFKDAGANYVWLDNEEKASLVKAKEIILDEAYDADFWLNQNNYNSVKSILDFDEKFKGFKSVKKQQLFNNNKRVNFKGGNDYWESGVVNPDVVLKDLIKIFHPKLIQHELYYYQQLK